MIDARWFTSSTRPRPGWARLALGALVAFSLAACSDSLTNAAVISPQNGELVAEGSVLYQANCAECHGSEMNGTDRGPSFLSDIYEPDHHSDLAFLFAVQRGSAGHHWRFGDMPPVEGVGEDDVAAIVAFVRETQRIQGFQPSP